MEKELGCYVRAGRKAATRWHEVYVSGKTAWGYSIRRANEESPYVQLHAYNGQKMREKAIVLEFTPEDAKQVAISMLEVACEAETLRVVDILGLLPPSSPSEVP